MRFELSIQELFRKLAVKELGFKLTDFSDFEPPKGESPEFPKYVLHKREMSIKQIIEWRKHRQEHPGVDAAVFSHHTKPFDLLKFGVYRILKTDKKSRDLTLRAVVEPRKGKPPLIEQLADDWTDKYSDRKTYNRVRTQFKLVDKIPDKEHPLLLSSVGFWNALSAVLSPGAVAKIRDTGTFYHLMPENPSASEWSIFWLRLFRSDAGLSTIKGEGGVYSVVTRLHEKLKQILPTDTFRLGRTVRGIHSGKTAGKVGLKIKRTVGEGVIKEKLEFDHVILALPTVPLRKLMKPFPENIRYYIDGVIPFPLLKVFAVIKDRWWQDVSAQTGAHLLPTREVHYLLPEDGSNDGIILLYMDRPATAYWGPYIEPPHEKAQVNEWPKLKWPELRRELVQCIARLWPRDTSDKEEDETYVTRAEESIKSFAIRDWSHAPFGAACHAWKPRINVPKALAELKAFGLTKTHDTKNIHICGEAYSDYQGFIEGALRSAADVLATIIGEDALRRLLEQLGK